MQKIPTLPKESKIISRLKRLPPPVQLMLIAILLYLSWHFRYYTTGVNEAELTKVEGTLYSFECRSRFRGSDDIILYTSLREEEIWLRAWQKCKNLSDAMSYAGSPQEVIFHTQRTRGIFSKINKTDGILRVYAVDLKSPRKQLIYPANGLGKRLNPNILAILLACLAFVLADSLREQWWDKHQAKKKAKAEKHSD
ncbi:hypothetical protein [Alishewanella sp. HH-ZS]|uniref:hypothetical protein n=1 Tax=Alishewanella sp. HH-ZS TaxID=1856684 RepID=UPI000823601A|nr:hypothetical protein [Alishewanella sp. HH-ZS]OCW96885.1 hypothetical protein A9165_09045 [Alishewanella sp. HH-ZS]